MELHIDNSLFLVLFIMFIPQFHLLFIFLVMGIGEWIDSLFTISN